MLIHYFACVVENNLWLNFAAASCIKILYSWKHYLPGYRILLDSSENKLHTSIFAKALFRGSNQKHHVSENRDTARIYLIPLNKFNAYQLQKKWAYCLSALGQCHSVPRLQALLGIRPYSVMADDELSGYIPSNSTSSFRWPARGRQPCGLQTLCFETFKLINGITGVIRKLFEWNAA